MLEMIMDRHLQFVLLGAVASIGLISKIITGVTLKKLVWAAANRGKSTHPLMRLIRAKYEHACMVSDRVQNVEVFVEKYIYEYRIAGLSLHSWRRLEKGTAWICAAIGVLAALGEYVLHGMNDQVLRNGAFGLAAGVILFALRVSVDENYRLQAIRTYMVDYLDNFCARKYEKNREKSMLKCEEESASEIVPEEKQEMKQEMKQEPVPELMPENIPVKEATRESIRETIREPEKIPEREVGKAPKREAEKVSEREPAREPATKPAPARRDKNVSKEVLIREILEEYLA